MPLDLVAKVQRAFHYPVLRRLWVFLALLAVYATVICEGSHGLLIDRPTTATDDTILVGLIFGLLMSFRTNTAYDRWYEGRKLWGQLVNDSRNLYLKVLHLVRPAEEELTRLRTLLSGFAFALKEHLRDEAQLQKVPGFETAAERPAHVPQYLAGLVFERLGQWKREGRLDGLELVLDAHARGLMDVCGACERIRKTPLVTSYRSLLRKGVALYLLLTPWLLGSELGLWAVPVVLILSYPIISLELIAHEIEDPFGHDGDDLPLEDICQTIAGSVDAKGALAG